MTIRIPLFSQNTTLGKTRLVSIIHVYVSFVHQEKIELLKYFSLHNSWDSDKLLNSNEAYSVAQAVSHKQCSYTDPENITNIRIFKL